MKPFGQTCLIRCAPAALFASAAPAQNITTIAGRGIGDGRPAPSSSLDTPVGVEVAADGAILIADSMHHRIRRVDPATNVITTLAGTLEGVAGDGGTPDTAELKLPVRVLVAPSGDILIVEKDGLRIRRIRKDTGLVDTVPVGAGIPNFTLAGPNDVAVDAANNIYIADFAGHRVYR
jgi:sugar lactone lactonase YvrE